MLVRKNILIEEDTWNKLEVLKNINRKKDRNASISKIIQTAVDNMIKEQREKDIVIDMNLYEPPLVAEDEEKEILNKLKNISKEDMKVSRKLK